MTRARINYLIIIMLVIIFGLASRHFKGLPLWPGDVLWALMIFYMVRFAFIRRKIGFIITVSLCFCYLIEISQLYQAVWINNIRNTLLGSLILGFVFSWGDILSYTAGVGIGFLLEYCFKRGR